MLPRNLGECFILFFVEPIAGKNMSPSDKQLWRFLKNILVAEKSQCKALSIGCQLEIYSLLLMSAENNETLTFVSLKFFFFITSCSSAICRVLSINSQVQVQIRADEERSPTHCSIMIELRLGLFMLSVCVQNNIFVARVLHFVHSLI